MNLCLSVLGLILSQVLLLQAEVLAAESVYVEASLDTDQDGANDRIYMQIDRPTGTAKVPSILTMSPYALGGNDAPNHNVDVRLLPQDESIQKTTQKARANLKSDILSFSDDLLHMAPSRGYASLSAHSLGTGRSTGCPTVGDESETLAAKAVIDWLNGRGIAYSAAVGGTPVAANWSNGHVGMTGVSYNGTLPNMVATTGVDGLKAIVPVAAISSWYDYYRANGLVVGPGGYVGEDADVLAKYVVRKGQCSTAIANLARVMGREHGDYTTFWQERDYVTRANGVRAAVFIIHGQNDWNVRQRHAIRWYEALDGKVPLRMWLHKGGHSTASRADTSAQVWKWFDRYVKGIENGVETEPAVEVESPNGKWISQNSWPNEQTTIQRFYLNADANLSNTPGSPGVASFTDKGKNNTIQSLVNNPTTVQQGRLAFVSKAFTTSKTLSGTPKVTINLAVLNRKAANLTVVVIDYDTAGSGRIITRGWADPQNHVSLESGEKLDPTLRYQVTFDLEPKQYTFAPGHRLGIMITGTDYEHTLRPDSGTVMSLNLGQNSFIDLSMSDDAS
jgi:X-Pro dipeptidyl-peptidase